MDYGCQNEKAGERVVRHVWIIYKRQDKYVQLCLNKHVLIYVKKSDTEKRGFYRASLAVLAHHVLFDF